MSAETLNFGPQWLRDLSGGSGGGTATTPTGAGPSSSSKFELAQHRYGREEMLALFVEDTEIPDELLCAPSLMLEDAQLPLALKPETNPVPSGGYRGRGGITTSARGRSIPVRGRGRGRGATWDDHDDGMRKPPLLRRAESEDWRSDSLRGKGDGAEDMLNGMKEWRISGQRRDPIKDSWRDRPTDGRDTRPFRSRAASAKEPDDSSGFGWDEYKAPETNRELPSKSRLDPERSNSSHRSWRKQDTGPISEEDGTHEQEAKPDQIKEAKDTLNAERSKPLAQAENEVKQMPDVPKAPPEGLNEVVHAGNARPSFDTNNAHQKEMDPMERNFVENVATGGIVQPIQDPLTTVTTVDTSSFLEASTPITQPVASVNDSRIPSAPFTSNQATPMSQLQALATTWYYKDPQGDTQGPFNSGQMMEWFNAGYFTMVLQVRRACDQQYTPLGDLIKKWGFVPFRSATPLEPATVQPMMGNQVQEKLPYQQPVRQQENPQRTYPDQKSIETFIANLVKTSEFRSLSPHHQQQYISMVINKMQQQQSLQAGVSNDVKLGRLPQAGGLKQFDIFEHDRQPQNPSAFHPDLLHGHAKALEEKRRKEEEEMQRIKKEHEEEKERLRRQEEELRLRNEMLLQKEEEMKRLHLEAQRKKQELEEQEALKKRLEEQERQKKEQEELMRRRKMEMEAQRKLQEEIAKQEADLKRKLKEEELKREQEQKRKAEEEWRKLEEERRRKMEEERRRKMAEEEEARRKQLEEEECMRQENLRQQEEARKLELQKEAARKQREKAEQEERERRLLQERQMQQMQLPSTALWGNKMQTHPSVNTSMSLLEIQQLQQEHEKAVQKEREMRMGQERQKPQKPKSGWAAPPQIDQGGRGKPSLLDIQRQEAEQMVSSRQVPKSEAAAAPFSFNTSWNKPLKIQPEAPKKPVPKEQANFWDQVVEESSTKKSTQKKQQNVPQPRPKASNAKQKKPKNNEENQVKALFQQQLSKDGFTEWCEEYLKRINAGHLDIPTFINFLRDVESPYEVEEYVQSYLGETKEAKEFAKQFLEKRKSGATMPSAGDKVSGNGKEGSGPRDADGFVFVTGNTKRSKKKLRKLQKVDPSILGFSVNAASDRVNMGEIQTADD